MGMNIEVTNEIVQALQKQPGLPLQLRDAAGQIYYIMTDQQFQQFVYDDSELTPDEMIAAANSALDDSEDWDAPGMEDYEEDFSPPSS